MIESAVRWLLRAASVVRRVIGAPDYERYLAHMRDQHPGCAPLSRERFIDAQTRARYDRPGSRCC
jgi:uncharacterized short protein YbdD (DUF466 family)